MIRKKCIKTSVILPLALYEKNSMDVSYWHKLVLAPNKSQVMEEALEKGDSSKLSLSEMKKQLQKAMGQNAGSREVKPLRECPRLNSFFPLKHTIKD